MDVGNSSQRCGSLPNDSKPLSDVDQLEQAANREFGIVDCQTLHGGGRLSMTSSGQGSNGGVGLGGFTPAGSRDHGSPRTHLHQSLSTTASMVEGGVSLQSIVDEHEGRLFGLDACSAIIRMPCRALSFGSWSRS